MSSSNMHMWCVATYLCTMREFNFTLTFYIGLENNLNMYVLFQHAYVVCSYILVYHERIQFHSNILVFLVQYVIHGSAWLL